MNVSLVQFIQRNAARQFVVPAKVPGLDDRIYECSQEALKSWNESFPIPASVGSTDKSMFVEHAYRQMTHQLNQSPIAIVEVTAQATFFVVRFFVPKISFLKWNFIVLGQLFLIYYTKMRPVNVLREFVSENIGSRLVPEQSPEEPEARKKSSRTTVKAILVALFFLFRLKHATSYYKAYIQYVPLTRFRSLLAFTFVSFQTYSHFAFIRLNHNLIHIKWKVSKNIFLLENVSKPKGFDLDPVLSNRKCSITQSPILFPIKLNPCGDLFELSAIYRNLDENGSCPNCRYGFKNVDGSFEKGELKADDLVFDQALFGEIKARIPKIGKYAEPQE